MTHLQIKKRFWCSGRLWGLHVFIGFLLLVFGVGPLEPLKFVAAESQDALARNETPEEEREEEPTENDWTLEASLLHHRRKQLVATTPRPAPGAWLLCACPARHLFSDLWTSFAKRNGMSSPMRC